MRACYQAYGLDGSKPNLVPTGLKAVDRVLRGLEPGECGILAADTGVGKSSIALAACLASPVQSGIISCEDRPATLGGRLLAAATGMDSRSFAFADRMTPGELSAINQALGTKGPGPLCYFPPTKDASIIPSAIEALAKNGAKFVWLDYIQNMSDSRAQSRRSEVGGIFRTFQEACVVHGVSGIAISQVARRMPGTALNRNSLKESGDLENEARLVILVSRQDDDRDLLRCVIDKSTRGAEGTMFNFIRADHGGLVETEMDAY